MFFVSMSQRHAAGAARMLGSFQVCALDAVAFLLLKAGGKPVHSPLLDDNGRLEWGASQPALTSKIFMNGNITERCRSVGKNTWSGVIARSSVARIY